MVRKPKILVVGSFVMDMIVRTGRVPNEGETVIDGISFSTAPGGKGANQAVQAARLGDELIRSAKEAGIDTRYVIRDETSSSAIGNITLEVRQGQKARNRIIVVPGANMRLTPGDVEFIKDIVSEYDMVMLQLEIPMRVNEIVAEYAAEKGIPVMLNSAPSAPLPDSLLSRLAYISPNEHEAADITGIRIMNSEEGPDFYAIKAAAGKLVEKGVRNVIITLGSNGVAFMNRDRFIYKPCVDIVEVVDPTAAGDSFTGAFCTAVCMGMNEEEALDFANYTATITVSRMGAQPSLPEYGEVVKLIQANSACIGI